MKDYLENRIKQLETEYNEALTQPAKSGKDIDNFSRKVQWCETECIRAKLIEVRSLLVHYKENHYTDL